MIVFDRLWQTMRKRNISQYKLIKTYGISIGRLGRLRKNEFTVSDNSYEKKLLLYKAKRIASSIRLVYAFLFFVNSKWVCPRLVPFECFQSRFAATIYSPSRSNW